MNKKEFTKKESMAMLVKWSGIITKIIKVLQIVAIVGMSLCLISGVLSVIGYGLGWASSIYEANPKIGKWGISSNSIFDEIVYDGKYTVEQMYLDGNLDKLMLGFGFYCVVGFINCIVLFVVLVLFKPLFVVMNNSQTPFTYEILRRLKFAFILIFVMLLLNSVVGALITGAILTCVYFIYMYGVKMQEEEDMTL